MESDRPFTERMSWHVTTSCGCSYEVLLIVQREVAFVMGCPAGWAMRLNRMAFGKPGAHEVYPTREGAMQAAWNWFAGMDIVPWD